jgi:hypothetical protein
VTHRPSPSTALLAAVMCLPGAAKAILGAPLGGVGVHSADDGGSGDHANQQTLIETEPGTVTHLSSTVQVFALGWQSRL